MEKEELKQRINEIEESLKPLKQKLREIYHEEEFICEQRIKKAQKGEGDFNDDELIFAAYTNCPCGHGMSYPKTVGIKGSWYCSAILMGIADKDVLHEPALPFSFYDIKSEDQPSSNGATTRKK